MCLALPFVGLEEDFQYQFVALILDVGGETIFTFFFTMLFFFRVYSCFIEFSWCFL